MKTPIPGLALTSAIAILSTMAVSALNLSHYGLSPLTMAIALGAIVGNTYQGLAMPKWHAGIRISQRDLLRIGVALYGFNLSLHEIATIGAHAIWIDLFMVCSTLLLGWVIGTRLLGLDRETTILTAAGSAICGAAAVVATAPVLKMSEQKEAESTSAAVATVILFGTATIFIYPLLYTALGGLQSAFGTYIGSTVHEVAQVVAIGNLVGEDTEHAAVVVKMIRVILLVPFLMIISNVFQRRGSTEAKRLTIPWFAIGFIAIAAGNSLHLLSENVVSAFKMIGTFCLTSAMAALGLDTKLSKLRSAGPKVFLLGFGLFAFLMFGGGLVNYWVASLIG